MLLQAWPLWGHGERRIRNTALSLFPERCSLQPWDGSCLPSHPLAALPPLCSPLTPILPCAVPKALPVPSLLAPSGLGGCPGRSVQPPSLGRADSPRPKSCSLHPAVTAGPISAAQEGRCRSHTAQIRSDPIQRRSPATQEIQTDTASVTLRAEESDPGSLSPCQPQVPAWVPGALPPCPWTTSSLLQALRGAPHPALLCSGRAHPASLCTATSQGFGLSPALCGRRVSFKNTRIVSQSDLCSAIVVRKGLNSPLTSLQNL